MESIHDVLPQSKKINMIFDRIKAYLDERSSSPEDMRDIIDPVRRWHGLIFLQHADFIDIMQTFLEKRWKIKETLIK